MTSKERVLRALNHQEPGAVPFDLGGTAVSGIHVTCVAALRDHYGLEKRPVKIHEPYQMLGWMEEDLKQAIGLDVDGIIPRNTMFGFPAGDWKPWSFNGLDVLVPGKYNIVTDEKGDTLIFPEGDMTAPPSGRMPKDGYFFDTIVRQPPIDEDKLNPEDNLEEFGPIKDIDLAHFQHAAERVKNSGRAVIANFGGTAFGDIALVPAPFLKYPKGIRDVAEWYMSTATRRDYVHKMFEKQCEYALANLAKISGVVGNVVDAVFLCGTDFGTQTSSFCSVATLQELYAPYYKAINDWIHKNTNWKTFKHSCGAVEKFIPTFIESGYDILNPVQCSATGMAPEHLKSTHGDRIVFWGGGIDTQKILPFGTPAEVREMVLRRLEVFSKGGGYIFNPIHNVQARTPVANIAAMVEAVREFNGTN